MPLIHQITSFLFSSLENKGEACVNLELPNLCLDGTPKLIVPGCDQIPFRICQAYSSNLRSAPQVEKMVPKIISILLNHFFPPDFSKGFTYSNIILKQRFCHCSFRREIFSGENPLDFSFKSNFFSFGTFSKGLLSPPL